ncbi:hypothetical protein ACTJKE_07145 [Ensifer sp. 22521]|uniref:hypothetical protein n=1 Tax=Ensifer sp. 22521 TaxID=3453935 RepID=UPI003F85BFEF
MPIIKITNISDIRRATLRYRKTVIVRPEGVAGPELSVCQGLRGCYSVRLRDPPYPETPQQCSVWFRDEHYAAKRRDDGDTLVVFPDVVDFVSGQFAREAFYLACFAVTVVADSVEDAVTSLWGHGISGEEIAEAQFLDLTGEPSTHSVALPERVIPAPPVFSIPSPNGMSLDDYVANTRSALIRRWTSDVNDTAFTGVFSVADLKARFRNGYAKRYDLSTRRRKKTSLRADSVNHVDEHLDDGHLDGFGAITKNGLLEVWVNAALDHRGYAPLFRQAAMQAHGFDYDVENRGRFDLDHAFGRKISIEHSRAKYVLLVPIRKQFNRSWGYIERFTAHDPIGHPAMQQATWFTMPKMLGLYAPSLSRDGTIENGLLRISRELLECGAIFSHQTQEAILGLKDLYQGVWRGKDVVEKRHGCPVIYPDDRFKETRAMRRKQSRARRNGSTVNAT